MTTAYPPRRGHGASVACPRENAMNNHDMPWLIHDSATTFLWPWSRPHMTHSPHKIHGNGHGDATVMPWHVTAMPWMVYDMPWRDHGTAMAMSWFAMACPTNVQHPLCTARVIPTVRSEGCAS